MLLGSQSIIEKKEMLFKMKKKMRLELYRPKRKIGVSKQEAVPFLVRVGGVFLAMGGFVSFVLSGMIVGVKSFFDVKKKVYDKNLFGRKYVELRIKK